MADIGTTLREARMRAKIDIGEVEARTKIRAKYLRAIENEEWDLLPGPVYAKSFLRTYGDFLGLDSRMLVDEFKRRYELPSDNELRPVAPLGRERDRGPRRPRLPSWAPIGVVLAAVIVVLYLLGSGGGGNKNTPPASTSANRGHGAHTQTTRTTPAPAPPATVTLQLVPTGQVYVCLVNGRGKQLIPGRIFTPGQTIPTETARKLLLTLGNASVQMKVNGKSVPVTPSSTSIGWTLLPTASSPLPPAQQPRCA
jgi:Helix-turn-helix domain